MQIYAKIINLFDSLCRMVGGTTHALRYGKLLDIDHEIFITCQAQRGGKKSEIFLKKFDLSANYRPKSQKKRFLEMQFLDMLTSRNFAELSMLTSEIIPENFRSISERLTVLQNNR